MSRPKRANAGSKMGELIAEQIKAGLITIGTEEVADKQHSEPKIDKDFTAGHQDDVFDSDFESTDEEEEIHIMTKSSTVVNNIDFDDEAAEKAAKKKRLDSLLVKPIVKKPPKSRSTKDQRGLAPVRQSGRSSTQESSRLLIDTLYEHDLRRRENPRPKKRRKKTMTQEERLEEAKMTEVQNLESLDLYKQLEDENKLRARATKRRKHTLTGPIIRYHSFYYGGGDEDYHLPLVKESQSDIAVIAPFCDNTQKNVNLSNSNNLDNIQSPKTIATPIAITSQSKIRDISNDQPLPFQRTNLSFIDFKGDPFSSMNQKQQLPEKICPITGQIAKYRCPQTLVPYATLEAYKTIKRIRAGEWMWSSVLGTFCHRRDVKLPRSLPKDWALNFGIVRTEPQYPVSRPPVRPSEFIPFRPPAGFIPSRPPFLPGMVRPLRPGSVPVMHVLPRPGMHFRPVIPSGDEKQ